MKVTLIFNEGKIETCFPVRKYNARDKRHVFMFSANFIFEAPVQKLSLAQSLS